MTTFGTCTYQEFKKHASDFFKMCKTSDVEQIENGFKALTIFWLSVEDATESEIHQSNLVLEIAARKF